MRNSAQGVITSDNGQHSIYRVNLVTDGGWYAVNVKASTPSDAARWVLCYPQYAGVHLRSFGKVTHAYKLKKQPVWLKKSGQFDARFDLRKAF
jgi:hypothetical protein